MKNRAFHFEIKDLLTQFIAAFDDVVIKRYTRGGRDREEPTGNVLERTPKQDVEVRYVFAPKQRVMYDIINKAQNLTLPVVSVDIASVSRDDSRVFNKLEGTSPIPINEHMGDAEQRDLFVKGDLAEQSLGYSQFLMPVPINLEVNMSILARYMSDIDQIISNFVPYTNPYIILSWKVPADFGAQYIQEIRSEVLWSGDLAYNTPTDTTYNDHFRITVDTGFTIKGWLFAEKKSTQPAVFEVDSNMYTVDQSGKTPDPGTISIDNLY